MPWLIGIDEAGYGPNLGPLVMTLVACRAPKADADLWECLKPCVRRHGEADDGRLLVADSKLVHVGVRGLAGLERGALTAFADDRLDGFALHRLIERLAPEDMPALRAETWYTGASVLPVQASADVLADDAARWRTACAAAGLEWGFCRAAVVCAPRFNDLVDRWDSKAAVLGLGLTQLVRACVAATCAEPAHFVIDKLGGRNQYSALLQEAFGAALVQTECEGRACSRYRVGGLDRPVRVTFEPRADQGHFTVALASMVSKYLREVLMAEFNRFWQRHVADLEPTAGYPGDAARYLEAIRPALQKLGLTERQVWRAR